MIKRPDTKKARQHRHTRVRGKVYGTAQRPRLNVFRSSMHIYAQLIDDDKGITICEYSTVKKDFTGYGGNKEAARQVGKKIAEIAQQKGITEAVFDRGGYLYHGRVMELAEGAREGGLKF